MALGHRRFAKALGAMLSQLQSGIEKVIQFASKVLKAEQQRYCITKRELLASTWSLKTFRHYLLGREVRLRTDHVSVKYWKTMETGMPDTIQKWLQHTSTYNLIVEYRPGKQHGNADGLSRPQDIDICGRRGCVCAIALANVRRCWAMESSDGEPDFENHPSIPMVETTMIGLVTRSGRNTREEDEEGDLESDESNKNEAAPSQRRRGELRPEEVPPPVEQICRTLQNENREKLAGCS
jgi:hypothetical protein